MTAVLQVTGALVLLVAAGGKIVAPGDLATAIKASRTVPKRAASVVATSVIAAELILAIAALTLSGSALAVAFAGVAALGTAFLGWSLSVLVRGITLRCGCFGGASKNVTWWTAARALALMVLGVAGAALSSEGSALLQPEPFALIAIAGACLGVLLVTAFLRTRSMMILTANAMTSLQSLTGEVRN